MDSSFDKLKAALAERYEIERPIGQGGMASVYLASDVRHQRRVAVKVLRPDLAAALGGERFLREIRIAANLTHPHILPLHDSGVADGFLYYVMPYIEGDTLRDRLEREGALPVRDAVVIVREVADALAAAHAQGVVHRDIKPDNIMLAGGHAVVMDFGVAKAVSEATGHDNITTAGVALGTPAYMSPEQATADQHVDHRSDIYALGVMAYELLAGRPPFQGATAQAVLAGHVTAEPDPVSKHRGQVSPELEAVVMKCLAKQPADRWQSAAELVPYLEAAATPSGGVTPTDTRPLTAAPTRSWARRYAVPLTVVAIVAAVILGFTLLRPSPNGESVLATRLAVFPFRVTGPDEEVGYLRSGLVHLLSTALDGAGEVRAIDPQSAVMAAGDRDLDAPAARTAASRLGAGMFILGSATSVGAGRVQVSASLYQTDEPDPITARTTGSPEDVLGLTGDLARQLLAGYSVVQPASIDSLALLTTESIDALKAYLRGMEEYRAGRWFSALDAFQTAVAHDSMFALGYYGISRAASWAEQGDQAREAAEKALRLGGRLSQRHRDLLRAAGAYQEGRPIEAERYALEVVGDHPEDFDGWYLLGEIRLHLGPFVGGSYNDAKDPFSRAVAIDPGRGDAFEHAYDLALLSGDIEEVEQLFRMRAERPVPDSAGEVPLELRVARFLVQGDEAATDSILALVPPASTGAMVYWSWRTGKWWGHQPTGLALTVSDLDMATTPVERALRHRSAANFELLAGKKRSALEHLARSAPGHRAEAMVAVSLLVTSAFPLAPASELRAWRDTLLAWDATAAPSCPHPDPSVFLCTHQGDYALIREYFLGLVAARLGERDAALRYASAVEDWVPPPDDLPLPADLAHAIRAFVAQSDGRPSEALAELDSLARQRGIYRLRASEVYKLSQPHFLKAELLREQGRYQEAIRWYQSVSDVSFVLQPASELRIGEIHEELGEADEAVARYSKFLKMWADADPEFQPLVEDVRQRVVRLTGESAP